jgi:hypothetical protein
VFVCLASASRVRKSEENRAINGWGFVADIGKYSFVNRTIQLWNQLPADVLGTLSSKSSNFRKVVRKVITKNLVK